MFGSSPLWTIGMITSTMDSEVCELSKKLLTLTCM
jgi:hypothetical protein